MPTHQYPLLKLENGEADFVLSGRLITFGTSRDCNLQLQGKGLKERMGHFLFREGKYFLQVVTADSVIKCNGVKVTEALALVHGDHLELGISRYHYLDKPINETDTFPIGESPINHDEMSAPLGELIEALVELLRERGADVFTPLVSGVSRLLRCDAARVVIEDKTNGLRHTIARYPMHSGLERFSDRAIDWAKASSHAVLLHEGEWEDKNSLSSLRTNDIASILCVALREGGDTLGYLYMDRLGGGIPFTEKERLLCDTLSKLFGEILSRHGEAQRQKETIERLQKVSMESKGGMIYASPAMLGMMELAARIAKTDATVLIRGETGTGKELLARYVHENSKRMDKTFVALNCGAIPANLIESELFGHEKGSFTGADQRKVGLFESAHQGTLFLDEIGELPLSLQVKMLRVLQEGEVTRIGSTKPITVDVRIVCATHRDLSKEIQEGRFRQDLFFRLSVLGLLLPPLRERGQDILLLADYLLKKYLQQFGLPLKTFSVAARNKLLTYRFPGNIRELENIMQKAVLFSNTQQIRPEDLQWDWGDAPTENGFGQTTLKEVRQQADKKAIAEALGKTAGNVSLAAKMLDVDRKWLMKLMEEADLRADDYRK